MTIDKLLRKNFWIVMLPLVALAAFLDAQAVSALVGINVAPDEKELSSAPPVRVHDASRSAATTNRTSADPILTRNPFDHVTGPLHAPVAEGVAAAGESALPSGDPWEAPTCDDVDVLVIMASDDPDWSFAALKGNDGKSELRRRGGDIGGKKVEFIGVDRVWMDSAGARCQAKLYDAKKPKSAPTAAPTTSASSAPRPVGRGSRPLDPDIKKGIQKVGPTEFNIDRGVVDKILENQAELMRQARVIPVQENGRVVGIRMQNIRKDSLLEVLGMQNGDRLQTINGFDMGSPEKALEAYARLRTADKLTVQINRGGKVMNLDYNIR